MISVPAVIYATLPDEQLDRVVLLHRGHRRVHCARNPGAYERDDVPPPVARLACLGCPIMLACREQALRQETAVGESHGVRGGMNAEQRQDLIGRRAPREGRQFLPSTWNQDEVLHYLATERGYEIKRNTWQVKCKNLVAPRPVARGKWGSGHWDVREVIGWDHTATAEPGSAKHKGSATIS